MDFFVGVQSCGSQSVLLSGAAGVRVVATTLKGSGPFLFILSIH